MSRLYTSLYSFDVLLLGMPQDPDRRSQLDPALISVAL
jgi:hypothetical protein